VKSGQTKGGVSRRWGRRFSVANQAIDLL